MNNQQLTYLGVSYTDFVRFIDNMFDEVIIYDKNFFVTYVNKACARHYGCIQSEMIGQSFFNLQREEWWNQSILPVVIREKRIFAIRQKTKLNTVITTIATPVFSEKGELTHVVMNVHDEIQEQDLYYLTNKDMPKRTLPIMFDSKSKQLTLAVQKANTVIKKYCNCVLYGEKSVGKSEFARFIQMNLPEQTRRFELNGPDYSAGLDMLAQSLENIAAGRVSLIINDVDTISAPQQQRLLQLFRTYDDSPIQLQCLATCRKSDLELLEALEEKSLFYYLNSISIVLPPLCERRQDLPELISFYMSQLTKKYGCTRSLSREIVEFMENYSWPGNFEELQHVMQYLVLNSKEIEIFKDSLPPYLIQKKKKEIRQSGRKFSAPELGTFDEKMQTYERFLVRQALEQKKSSRGVAAALGISQTRAANLIRKYGED